MKSGIGRTVLVSLLFCVAITMASPAQTFSVLVNLDPTTGSHSSYAPLVQGVDGNFYGSNQRGGVQNCNSGCGSVFSVNPTGQYTILHEFSEKAEGFYPENGVTLATDGNFYGTTADGGMYSQGSVFRMAPDGTVTTLYSFCSQADCPDGREPEGQLLQASDGNLYRTTQLGSSNQYSGCDCGTLFRMTLDGQLTTLVVFEGASNGSREHRHWRESRGELAQFVIVPSEPTTTACPLLPDRVVC
ncbi:MAG: hypothetical protein H0X25_14845 [Acidobacteriales bacterium]|nr:hypothetical protein [Terriglobales bacterium]